jgi:hypothetical protein
VNGCIAGAAAPDGSTRDLNWSCENRRRVWPPAVRSPLGNVHLHDTESFVPTATSSTRGERLVPLVSGKGEPQDGETGNAR